MTRHCRLKGIIVQQTRYTLANYFQANLPKGDDSSNIRANSSKDFEKEAQPKNKFVKCRLLALRFSGRRFPAPPLRKDCKVVRERSSKPRLMDGSKSFLSCPSDFRVSIGSCSLTSIWTRR